MRIKPRPGAARLGDFEPIVESESELSLPQDVVRAVSAQGVRTAAEFISYLQAFPSAVASELNWNVADVTHALDLMRSKLRGHVDQALLDPQPQRPRAYGAINPQTLKRQKSG